MKFLYKKQNKSGSIVEGIEEAPDQGTVVKHIRDNGELPISVEKYNKKRFNINKITFFSRVSLSEKIIFTNNLSGMLSAGLSLTRALSVLSKQSTNDAMIKIIDSLINEINKGGTLSSGMSKFPKVFSKVFVSMVLSGEESGGLPRVLSEIGITLKKNYDLRKKIKAAMIYPSIILTVIFIIGTLMMIYVVPTLVSTFKDLGTKLPSSTRFIIWLSDTLSHHLLLFLFIVSLLITIFVLFAKLKRTKRYYDYFILHIPVIGTLVKETNSAVTTRTLSSLLSSGVDLSKALTITKDILQNSYYKKVIDDSIKSVEKGVALSISFKENIDLYPVMVGEMMEVGEETGKLSEMLINIATFYENEVDEKTKNLSVIIEPILMIFIGSAVGFFAVSMITPMYTVMDNIN